MRTLITSLAVLVLAACAAPATFTHTHKGADVGPLNYQGRKVAAVVIGTGVTENRRVRAEDVLAKTLTDRGMQGVAGHTIIPLANSAPMTRERAIALLQQAGVAGVVLLQLVDTEKKTVQTQWASTEFQGTLMQRDMYGPIGMQGNTFDRNITTITIDTTLYRLDPVALLWSGQSESVNPGDIDAFIPRFASSIADELRREGLLK
ncbi:MAG: hypothetical protein NT115_07565 [Proteobacteria bacterium]|nr:hypothetical protein [Pseudomonadota bacterium]